MKIELDYARGLIRESEPHLYAGAIGLIRNIVSADYSPFAKLRNVRAVLTALETVLAENN